MSSSLPTELRLQLDAFRRRLFMQETLWAAATLLGGLVAAAVCLFCLDRFVETPHGVRLGLLLAGLGVAAFGAGRWALDWVVRPRDDRRLSLLVQRKYPRLGDSLLSAIELSEGRITDDTISPELRRAAVASVAAQAGALDFVRAVNWRATARIVAGAATGLALAAVLGIACMPALRATFIRLVNPFAEVVRHTFTRFKPLADRVVPRGEPFAVAYAIDETSQWKPSAVHYRLGEGRPEEVALGRPIELPGQTEETALRVWAGDASTGMRIRPEARPALTGIKARVDLPAYLRLPPVETPCSGSLTVVEGAKVALFGKATRPLASLEAGLEAVRPAAEEPPASAPESPVPATPPAAPPAAPPVAFASTLAATLADTGFSLAKVEARGEAQMTLRWTDTLGLSGAAPHVVTLKSSPDRLPEARCAGLPTVIAMLPEETLAMTLEGADDFGVKALAVHCRHAASKEPGKWLSDQALPVAQGAPEKSGLSAEFTFCPRLLGIPEGSVVDLQAGAADYCPGHAEGLSPVHRVLVMTTADHARMMQELMADTAGKMDELANVERQLREAVEEMAKDPAKAKTPEGMRKLEELKAAEKANAEAMRKMEDKLADIAKQAMKNKDIPRETLAELAKMAKDMQEAAKASEEAAESMAAAQNSQDDAGKRKEMDKAAGKQKEAEEKLRRSAKELDRVQRKLDSKSFVKRLQREAEGLDGRTDQARKLLQTLVGATPEMMNPQEKAAVQELVDTQKKSEASAKAIAADLAGSYARSHHEPYHAVTKDMEDRKLDARNGVLGTQFAANQMFAAASGGKELAGFYRAWAKMLEDKEEEGGGGEGGQEGGQLPPEFVGELVRALESEQDLREEVRATGDLAKARSDALDAALAEARDAGNSVDEPKVAADKAAVVRNVADTAAVLGAMQDDERRALARTYRRWADPPEEEQAVDLLPEEIAGAYGTFVDGKRPLPKEVVQEVLAAIGAMNDAAELLAAGKAEAGAVAAQTDAIEHLAKILDGNPKGGGQAKQGKRKSGDTAMGQMLRKMRGKGNRGGRGQTGEGDPTGKVGGGVHADPARQGTSTKTVGAAGGFVPPEFQGDIDAYRSEVDKMEEKP